MGFRAKDSLAEQIAQHLADQITRGELLEGERIQELRIAKELNVSRGSVREALLLLERRHLIEIYARRGAIVTELTVQHVRALYEVLGLLAGRLLVHTLRQVQAADIQALRQQLQNVEIGIVEHDMDRFADEVFTWVRMSYRYADNVYLEEMLEDLEPALRRCTLLVLHGVQQSAELLYQGLGQLLELALTRDEARTLQKLDELLHEQCDQVIEALLRMKQVELAWAQRHRR